MKIKQTVRTVMVGLFLALGLTTFIAPVLAVSAQTNNGCETDTAIIKCDNVNVGKAGVENTGVWSLLLTAINILTAGIGIAAIGGIVYGSVLYTSAGGNQEQVKKALGIISNVVIGVIAYALMFSFLNFLIPGGLFN